MPVAKARHFEVIRTVFAMAEERDGVALADAAAAVDLPIETVRELLDPVLYLEFRDDLGEFIDRTRAFLLDEGDVVRVDEEHWLRDLAARPPGPCGALRLYAAATTLLPTLSNPPVELRRAIHKLTELLEGSVVIPSDRPDALEVCIAASRRLRGLSMTYTTDAGQSAPRRIEPHHVYTNWGKWYVQGPEVGDGVVKSWRVDRMIDATVDDTVTYDPPESLDLPDRFDLSEHEQTVVLRLAEPTIDNLPTPFTLEVLSDHGDGTQTVRVTVCGEHRLRHLLVAAGPDATVIDDVARDALRREHAAAILRAYGR